MPEQNENLFYKVDAHYTRTITRNHMDMSKTTEKYAYVFARNENRNYILIKHRIFNNKGMDKYYDHVFEASEDAYNELLEGHLNYTRKNRGRCNAKKGHEYLYHAKIRYHDKDVDTGYGTEDFVNESWIYHDIAEDLSLLQIEDLIDMDPDATIEHIELGDKAYKTLIGFHMNQFTNPMPPVPPYSDFLQYPNKESYMMPPGIIESENFKTDEFPKTQTSHYHTIIDMEY